MELARRKIQLSLSFKSMCARVVIYHPIRSLLISDAKRELFWHQTFYFIFRRLKFVQKNFPWDSPSVQWIKTKSLIIKNHNSIVIIGQLHRDFLTLTNDKWKKIKAEKWFFIIFLYNCFILNKCKKWKELFLEAKDCEDSFFKNNP